MSSGLLEDFEMMGFTRRIVLVCALVLLAGSIQFALAEPNAVEIDVLSNVVCMQTLQVPDGTTETLSMKGSATIHVFFEGTQEGMADDDDGDMLDEVQIELVELSLSGFSWLAGSHVHMRLDTDFRSMGQMEETTDSNTGVLDVPPFGSGTVESFFDVFFEVEMLGQIFYGEGPLRWQGLLREKPAGPEDFYESPQDVRLIDEYGQVTGLRWSTDRFHPNPTIEVDMFENAMCWLELEDPGGQVETVPLTGQSIENVFFEGPVEGVANDDDGDNRDEVQTEIVALELKGESTLLGPVILRLVSDMPSMGMMEEKADSNTGVLDVPPFAASGSVDSFFDVHFEIEVASRLWYGRGPIRWIGVLTHKPAKPINIYDHNYRIDLTDANGVAVGYSIIGSRYQPNPVVEVDVFDTSLGLINLEIPEGEDFSVELMGRSAMQVFFEGASEGTANDDDGNSKDEVLAGLTQLDLSGYDSKLGAVHLGLDSRTPTFGLIEEDTAIKPGRLDIPPFSLSGTASSFFDVHFEIEVLGRLMYGASPLRWYGQLKNKPPAPGDIYQDPDAIRLVDSNGVPTGYTLGANWYEPTACGDDEHPYPVGDLTKDCEVNLLDVAIIGLHWLECTKPQCD